MQFVDLKSQYKSIKNEIDAAIKGVLESAVFIGGKEVDEFERELTNFCGVKYAVSVNSGTDALFLTLKALDIKEGQEVITTPFTFVATAEAIAHGGAKPVFADINLETFNIDPLKIEEKITKKTKAILPVHLFGQMAETAEIMALARKHKLSVIEDTAQAIGAQYKNKKAGTFGDAGCLSFFPAKNLGAFGDAGALITDNGKLAEKVRLLKNHGSSPKEKYLNLLLGTNSRLDALQAAILRVKLKRLPQWSQERIKKALYYNENLKGVGDIITPAVAPGRTHIFHQYTIRTESRNKLQKHLKEKEIPTMIYYPLPLHLQPAFKYLGYQEGDLPEAEKASKQVLSLPLYPEISLQDQNKVVKEIKEFFQKNV